jgi:hypothetical protein
MAVSQNIMKTKLYALILLALTLLGSGFAQASKPLAERQQEVLSWKFGFMICHLQNHSTDRGRAASVFNSNVTDRPRRSVLALGRGIGELYEAYRKNGN